jgi:hypothetical protein
MYTTRNRNGISKMAIPVALIVILAAAGGLFFLARSPTTSTSSQSIATSLPPTPLRTTVNQLIQDVNNRNVDGLVTFYSPNSVVVWSGNTGGLVGKYSGPQNVRLIYAASVGKTTTMDANVSNYAEDVFSPTHVNATFAIFMLANSTTAGMLNATVNVSQEWNWGNAGWQISKENWAYKFFYASFLSANLGSATTFPQWGFMKAGGNPNLVSEKSFEWHAGPFVAAGVYAFLFSVVFVLAARLRSRDRGARNVQRRPSVT